MKEKNMLYKTSKLEPFQKELFLNPTNIYRGTPFWAWNCKMTKEQVDHTLSDLKDMGMGGAYFHCRTGMDMPYLGPEFMEMIHYAHEKAGENGMLTYLYDEDRWPSGSAGGLVTEDECYRSRHLVLSPVELPLEDKEENKEDKKFSSSAEAVSGSKRKWIANYAVKLEDGYLAEYKRLESINKESIQAEDWDIWYAYLEISGDNPWFNNQAYVNTLDHKAIAKFIETTYEAYYKELGKDFGNRIPAIFTDEPQFSFKSMLGYAQEKKRLTIPYTDDFEETYQKAYGESFLDHLPEIFWDLPGYGVSASRYHYHDHVCERFTNAYADQIGSWCKKHNIMLTGHMMREPFLEWQTMALGEAMRSYRGFGVPGIDMLCDRRELTTAKQAQSAVHQYNCEGMMSEMYGVTNWDFDFRGHKLAGDWQAALGVTFRVHHLTWTSMAGEAKRDYPAPIGYQSPWFKEYKYIEDYFSRINTVLTRGEPEVKVGVIHPIESYWLYWGTREHTDGIRKEMENNFINLVKWLLYGLMDFDFISESLLADFKQEEDIDGFQVGAMSYDVIVVPNCITLRTTTMSRLNEFSSRGGKIIFAGKVPEYVDAKLCNEPLLLCESLKYEKNCRVIGFNKHELLSHLQIERTIDIHNQDGVRTENMLYQMRKEGKERWLFLSHSEKPLNGDLPEKEILTIEVKGCWKIERLIAETGVIKACECIVKNGKTYWTEESYEYDSFLYHLTPFEENPKAEKVVEGAVQDRTLEESISILSVPDKITVSLEEDNVLLLDQAEYCFDDGLWMPKEEILRIDNLFRKQVGYPMRSEAYPQPWVNTEKEKIKHHLKLRFTIESKCEIPVVSLALEEPEQTELFWNGEKVKSKTTGWYTDRDIQTVRLRNLKKGRNILEVKLPFYSKFNVEPMYLLGDFGVQVAGKTTIVTEPIRELSFGDICMQGLPFYGGNIRYHVEVDIQEGQQGNLYLEATKFRCPVLKASLDGKEKGLISISPYRLNLGKVNVGKHKIDITAFGNRVNTFGPIHNCNQTEQWIGPNAWRTTGASWSYEYQLKPTGILNSPFIFTSR